MAQVLVRGLNEDVVERLRARAERNRRSLESELRLILEQAAVQVDVATGRALADALRQHLSNPRRLEPEPESTVTGGSGS